MGFWFPDAHLAADESVRYRGAGNLFKGRRQIGAQVTVTNRRVFIVPNRLDGLLGGGNRVELARDEVVTVHAEPADSPTARQRGLSARVRPQIEIRTAGATYVLTVLDPAELVQALG